MDTSHLDWPFLNDEHRALAVRIRDWAETEIAPTADDDPEEGEELDNACRALVCKFAADGWLGYCVTAPHGGRLAFLLVRVMVIIVQKQPQRAANTGLMARLKCTGIVPTCME